MNVRDIEHKNNRLRYIFLLLLVAMLCGTAIFMFQNRSTPDKEVLGVDTTQQSSPVSTLPQQPVENTTETLQEDRLVEKLGLELINEYFKRTKQEYNRPGTFVDTEYSIRSVALLKDRDCSGSIEGKCALAGPELGSFDDIILDIDNIELDQDYRKTYENAEEVPVSKLFKVRFSAPVVSSSYGRSNIQGFFHIESQQTLNVEKLEEIKENPENMGKYMQIQSFNFTNSCNNKPSFVCN